jgi:hypothetical protein
MATQYDTTIPIWMESNPSPQLEERMFNGRKLLGYRGVALISKFQGWLDNPRTLVPVESFRQQRFRDPNDDELLDIMLEISERDKANEENEDSEYETSKRKNELLQLANNIRLNGIRTPLIVTFDTRILDGNRRYFASNYLLRQLDKDESRDYQKLPVWVLLKSASREDEELILTELNSIDDCKVKWPYFVVAQRVYSDYVDRGMNIEELKQKYHDWTTSRIRTVIDASRVAHEFVEYHDDEVEAKDMAFRRLIWFDELRRSNSDAIKADEFKHTIFDLIMRSSSPFSKTKDFVGLQEIYNNPEAWEHLTTREGKEALRGARFVVERDRYEGNADAQSRVARLNSLLITLLADQQLYLVDESELAKFHELADQLPDPRRGAEANADRLIHALDELTSRVIAQLPQNVLEALGRTLSRIERQAGSFREDEQNG